MLGDQLLSVQVLGDQSRSQIAFEMSAYLCCDVLARQHRLILGRLSWRDTSGDTFNQGIWIRLVKKY